MLEISGIHIALKALDGTDRREQSACKRAAAKALQVAPEQLVSVERRRRSIDARKRNSIQLIFTLRVQLADGSESEEKLLARLAHHKTHCTIRLATKKPYEFPAPSLHKNVHRPVVVGAGCAGLFCALALARAGLEPLLVERGDNATRRSEIVEQHRRTGQLDPESNIQFGLGGAGTFSDGKLQTGTKSPAHRLILETFAQAGAQKQILWDAKPHIGSDVLPQVVTNLVHEIEKAGGEVRYRTKLIDFGIVDHQISSITLANTDARNEAHEEKIPTDCVVVACGHSARDVFELLQKYHVALERKTFAMGLRIEHLQAWIDQALWGSAAGNPVLGAAPYKLSCHLGSGRSAFSFCMCPGGYVVSAASETDGVCTNGMSLSDRAGTNANAGLLANVFPTDLVGDDPLAGVALQRQCEQAAFAAGGGAYIAPAQLVGDFLHDQASSGAGHVIPTYPRGVTWGNVASCLPDYIVETLRGAIPQMARHLHGFDTGDAVLTGVETRSSSPVRVVRTDDGQSITTKGLWPVGEGAGYAGGIMSAATDGILAAQKIVEHFKA